MSDMDFIVAPRWLIPVIPKGVTLENQAVVIKKGRIAEILPTEIAKMRFPQIEYINRPNHILTAGFINAHTHTPMTLLRGCADDLDLATWLNEHIWPLETKWVDRSFVRDGSDLAIIEMISSGTTCFHDMYLFPDETAAIAAEHCIRACVSMIVIDTATSWAKDSSEYIEKGLKVHDQYRDHPLIKTSFGPHAPYTVNEKELIQITTLSNQLEVPIHMHINETESEIDQSIDHFGLRPLQRLEKLGMLSPSLNAVHMTQLNDDEIVKLSELNVNVIHCPESNMKLASGGCRINDLLSAGVNVALGTDGAASNNDLDMLGEMKSAALLAKHIGSNACAISTSEALEMATINGAKALGLEDEIGSIEPNKAADMICIDLSAAATQPVLNPLSTLIYSASRNQVSDVWVAGKSLYKNNEFEICNQQTILKKTHEWAKKLI
ncbi:MAG: TRZ/ATZ family hydrolase [Pseudomonadota bacterium]|nr:TRZ/ATZ family hydrolase [Pseudomonadota bacterium]